MCGWEDCIETDLKEMTGLICPGLDEVEGSFEHYNEPCCFIKRR
jgi:hypothetical protein